VIGAFAGSNLTLSSLAICRVEGLNCKGRLMTSFDNGVPHKDVLIRSKLTQARVGCPLGSHRGIVPICDTSPLPLFPRVVRISYAAASTLS
jgi:hypothetical protein